MDVSRALSQIADIHQQMAKAEVYRGYRSLPIAASGLIGLVAAWAQPRFIGPGDGMGFVIYWATIGVCAAFVAASEIVYNYVVHEETAARRRTRLVVGQFVPAVAAGAAITGCIVHLDESLVALLPGLWAMCFGLGVFASRSYLPRASGWVALFYCTAGTALLWGARGPFPVTGWWVGGTFGVGQIFAAVVLYWNLERPQS